MQQANQYRDLALQFGSIDNSFSLPEEHTMISTTEQAADALNISPLLIQAVFEQESDGDGFLKDGRVKILFERHVFVRNLKKYNIDIAEELNRDWSNADILNPAPYKSGEYGKYTEQYTKLDRAKRINADCALMACSWGRAQILGENYRALGYPSVKHFVDVVSDKNRRLEAFVKYLQNKPEALRALRDTDFNRFSKLYNGRKAPKSYAINLSTHYRRLVAKSNPKKGIPKSRTVVASTTVAGGTVTAFSEGMDYLAESKSKYDAAISEVDKALTAIQDAKTKYASLEDKLTELSSTVVKAGEVSSGWSTPEYILLAGVVIVGIPWLIQLYAYAQDHGYIK